LPTSDPQRAARGNQGLNRGEAGGSSKMTRINTNIESLISRRVLGNNNASLNRSLQRLSTGLRINSGRDDPAGLIASETLRASKVDLQAATDNARRADTIMSITEGALQEVNSLLLELEGLVDRSANTGGLSNDEISANQLQIDAILSSINRLANTIVFGDKKLLNGGFAFTTSGVSSTNFDAAQINAAKIPDNSSRNVVVEVVTGSQFAFISGYGAETAGTGATTGALSATVTLEITGNFGTDSISLASGATQADIVSAVNASTELTGVSAILSSNSGGINSVIFSSTAFGSKGIVSVNVLTNATTRFNLGGKLADTGVDGTVLVNGQAATVDGLNASVRSGSLSVDLVMTQAFGTTAGTSTFSITGGGAKFNIAPDVSLIGQEAIGVQSVATSSLGNASVGFLSTLGRGQANDLNSGNLATAQRVVRKAVDQISSLRGRIGAFQRNTIGTAINSMLVTFENTSAAESAIRDTDFAAETSNLTRSQILANSTLSTLQIANASPQNVLSLLG